MKKTLFAFAVLLVSINTFASIKFDCQGRNSSVSGEIKVIGEPETNGTWNYVLVDGTVKYSLKTVSSSISQKLNMVLTEEGWSVVMYKIHDKSSDTVMLDNVNGTLKVKVVASLKNGIETTKLTCNLL